MEQVSSPGGVYFQCSEIGHHQIRNKGKNINIKCLRTKQLSDMPLGETQNRPWKRGWEAEGLPLPFLGLILGLEIQAASGIA